MTAGTEDSVSEKYRAGLLPLSPAEYRKWKHGHMSKVAYRKWWRAQRRKWQVYASDRNWMQVYSCRWTRDLRIGPAGARHWHLGHCKGSFGPIERVRYAWRRLALWPYYRLRHRYRVAIGSAQCMSASCKAHRTPGVQRAHKAPAGGS